MRLSRYISMLAVVLLTVSFVAGGWAAPAAKKGNDDATPFHVDGKAAVLGDLDTGDVLFEQNPDEKLPPASLTKVMTLYLVFDALANGNLKLDETLPVSERAWKQSGSRTFVQVGDRVKVEDLVLGIAVQSGNDACVVVAEHLGGSEEGFAQMMTNKARELGMKNSTFKNASGMPDPDHLTTARDLFILASSITRKFPKYLHFFQEKQYTFNGIRQENRNRLLWRDSSITGMKTGLTSEAGYCLIATSDKDGQRLGAIILNSKSRQTREEEALRLLRYGNRVFETVRVFEANALVRKLRVWKGMVEEVQSIIQDPVVVSVPRKDRGNLEIGLSYNEPLVAPLTVGQTLGSLVVKLSGKEILTRPVVAGEAVEEGGLVRSLVDSVRMRFGW